MAWNNQFSNFNQNQNAPSPNWNGGPNSFSGNVQNNQMGVMPQAQNMAVQRPMIPGRLINNLDDVAPGEVPMDGNPTYFPTADNERIYALRWTREGRIEPTVYIRQKTDANTNDASVSTEDNFNKIMDQLTQMQKEIRRISKPRRRSQYVERKQEG